MTQKIHTAFPTGNDAPLQLLTKSLVMLFRLPEPSFLLSF